jgi:hypothetical protein
MAWPGKVALVICAMHKASDDLRIAVAPATVSNAKCQRRNPAGDR